MKDRGVKCLKTLTYKNPKSLKDRYAAALSISLLLLPPSSWFPAESNSVAGICRRISHRKSLYCRYKVDMYLVKTVGLKKWPKW
ncbi:hypothetical protein HanIR_Chr07g0301651 [Helianthus annuus]|nr:hypothetical protein HanIR_Chr07g0301651 [Helianthus annuus]